MTFRLWLGAIGRMKELGRKHSGRDWRSTLGECWQRLLVHFLATQTPEIITQKSVLIKTLLGPLLQHSASYLLYLKLTISINLCIAMWL